LLFALSGGILKSQRGKENPTNRKGIENMFNFQTIEQMELWADMMEEYNEWQAFEADMSTNPYDDPRFAW
jgi:hypothetical protein